jgi:hypothetical protein
LSHDASTRVLIARDGDVLVLRCDGCRATRAVDDAHPVVDQLLSFLDEHAHAG